MSKIEHIIRSIEQAINSGALPEGARLPSVRSAAADYGVAKKHDC